MLRSVRLLVKLFIDLLLYPVSCIACMMGLFDITTDNTTLASKPWKHDWDYWSSFELYPEWTGRHYFVFRGIAHHRRDYLSATPVVVKAFKDLDGTTDDWRMYLETCATGREMARHFNSHLSNIGCTSKINFVVPTDVVMDNISDFMRLTRVLLRFNKKFSEDEVVLFEECLEGKFKHFVTETGKATGNGNSILDSFAHFTYHQSNEQVLICNLKGIEEDGMYKLTNPTVHSKSGAFGAKDKRDAGIFDFFNNHICTGICKQFIKPEIIDSETVSETKPSAPTAVFASDEADETSSKYSTSDTILRNRSKTGLLVHGPPPYSSADPLIPPPYEER